MHLGKAGMVSAEVRTCLLGWLVILISRRREVCPHGACSSRGERAKPRGADVVAGWLVAKVRPKRIHVRGWGGDGDVEFFGGKAARRPAGPAPLNTRVTWRE